MASLRSVRARPFDLPVARPVVTAAGVIASNPVVLIDARMDDGIVGSAYLRTYSPAALRALAALVEDAGELAAAGGDLAAEFRLLGTRGLVRAAVAGIDMALWDAEGKRRGVSLGSVLGAEVDRVPAYAGVRDAEEAADAMDRGFRAVKLKLTGPDLRPLRDVRSALGRDVELMVDFNQGLTVEEALALAPELDDLDLAWVEEPTDSADLVGNARIAAGMETALQLGENWDGADEMRRGLEARAGDLVMLDAMRIGGVSGWMEAAALAERHAVPLSSHAFPEFSAHLLAATPTRHWLEYVEHVAPILERPLEIDDGYAIVPARPGAGLEWDERALARLGAGH